MAPSTSNGTKTTAPCTIKGCAGKPDTRSNNGASKRLGRVCQSATGRHDHYHPEVQSWVLRHQKGCQKCWGVVFLSDSRVWSGHEREVAAHVGRRAAALPRAAGDPPAARRPESSHR